MKVNVIEKEKGVSAKLVVTIYKRDYLNVHNNIDVEYPTMDKFSTLLRFEFSSGVLNFGARKQSTSRGNIVRLHLRCEKPGFTTTLKCERHWSEWTSIGKIPYIQDSAEGKMHVLNLHVNQLELKSITFGSLSEDRYFREVTLVSDEANPKSVAVHKPCLAAHSPIFKEKLLTKWKDAVEIRLTLQGSTVITLVYLLEYIYYGSMPDDSLLELLLIAKIHGFENLMAECIFKIVNSVVPENLLGIRKFAIDYKLPELIDALKKITSDELLKTAQKLELLKISQVRGKNLNTLKKRK